MKPPRSCCLFLFALALTGSAAPAADEFPPLSAESKPVAAALNGLPLIFSEDFESGASRWQTTDPQAWKVVEQQGNHVFALTKKKSNFEPPVRSPYNRALVKDPVVSDFALDVRLQSTEPDYGHRSLVLFFGYQDDSHLYYVHFGKKTDDHANQIFIVNDAPRTKISAKTTPGTDWDDEWHHARVVRDVKSGRIEVYFDDMDEPVMTAVDKTFTSGQVGIGSFDDRGRFDRVLVYGEKAERDAGK